MKKKYPGQVLNIILISYSSFFWGVFFLHERVIVNLSDFAPWWSTNITVAVNIYLSDVPKMPVMPSGTIQANLYRKQLLFGNRGIHFHKYMGGKVSLAVPDVAMKNWFQRIGSPTIWSIFKYLKSNLCLIYTLACPPSQY